MIENKNPSKNLSLEIIYRNNEDHKPKDWHNIVILHDGDMHIISIPKKLEDILPPWSVMRLSMASKNQSDAENKGD